MVLPLNTPTTYQVRTTAKYTSAVVAESDRVDGEKLYLELKSRGILVRHFTLDRIKNFNRITIGTLDEMRALISAIKEILG